MDKIPVWNLIKCEKCGKKMKIGRILFNGGLETIFVCNECYKKIKKGAE